MRGRAAEQARGQHQQRAEEGEQRAEGDADQAERQGDEPCDRPQHQREQGERPAQRQQHAPQQQGDQGFHVRGSGRSALHAQRGQRVGDDGTLQADCDETGNGAMKRKFW